MRSCAATDRTVTFDAFLDDLDAATAQARSAADDENEACARIVDEGYFCRTCRVEFLASDGHPEPDCGYASWDRMNTEMIAGAIRSRVGERIRARRKGETGNG